MDEVKTRFNIAKKEENPDDSYYKIYLRQLFPGRDDLPFDRLIDKLRILQKHIDRRIIGTEFWDTQLVKTLLEENKPVSENRRRPGLIVKMFHTHHNKRDVFVKVYLYDPECPYSHDSIESNFKNEALFQLYANQLQARLDFISPELYSWGSIKNVLIESNPLRCLFLIMEYIPHITLKEATYSTENMKKIYQKVKKIDESLRGELLHHNDLHGGNIMVQQDPSLSKIVVLDFGEASMGPRRPLYH